MNRWEANLKHVGISRKIINDAIDNNPSIKHKLATDFYNNEVYLIQKCWNEYEVRWYYNGQIESDVLSSDLELECIINLS